MGGLCQHGLAVAPACSVWTRSAAQPTDSGNLHSMSDESEWDLCERLGLRLTRLRALTDTLESDLDPEAWGYAQLADLKDVEQRAIVSDQLIAGVTGVRANLMELAVSLADYHQLTARGLRIPRQDHWTEDYEHHLRVEMAQVSTFRALGSVLDCMAAVVIVILRVPRAPTYADFRDIERMRKLSEAQPNGSARDALTGAANVFDERMTAGLRWALEMRNAVIHRGRQIGFLLPRPDAGKLAIATTDPTSLSRERAQADRYLHQRPWLPEMDHLADTKAGIGGQWLHEPAQITMQALRDDLVDLVDALSEALQKAWTGAGAAGELPAPSRRWVIRDPPEIVFTGYAPIPAYAPLSWIHVNPATAVRIEIAERLRLRRLK
jgi:hypothetical protein